MKLHAPVLIVFLLLGAVACNSTQREGGDKAGPVTDSGDLDPGKILTEEDRGATVALDAPVTLSYFFSEGERFGYLISSTQHVRMFRDSTEDENNYQELRHWYRFEVLSARPGGGGRLRVHCDRVTFAGRYGSAGKSGEVAYDSDDNNSYDVEKRFAEHNAPVNAPFEITVEPDGRISGVDQLDGVVKNYLRDDYRSTRQRDLEAIKGAIADAKLKAVLQLAFQKLPEWPVGKDSTWRLIHPETLGYLAKEDIATYTVRDIVSSPRGRLAHIDVDIESRYKGDKTFDTGQGMATMETFDVTAGGLTVFNMQHGRLQRRSLRTDVHVRMYIETPEDLKKVAPNDPQSQNFWWMQKAFTEDRIEPYTKNAQDN
ncbi:MAG: hypothetical protein RRA94_08020 [Bacteroidota bacterium]|nr:hypothetical protein [Bacteroidota bacterium]